MKRALAVIDGEHYAPVVRDALTELPYDFVGALFAGGSEKLRGGEDYGVPVVASLEEGVTAYEPEIVIDLSDEPVLGPHERLLLASRALALGVPYLGPDFGFDPPVFAPFDLPSLSIVGTGKRVGKTAFAGYAARLLAKERDVVVVAMGRGGPAEPEVAEIRPTIDDLLELSREGRHAASDYLEDAALTGVVTIGCRRCGGGLAGMPAFSNVAEGARLAVERAPQLVIFEGSGSAIPPVATAKRILVVGAHQQPELVTGYLNAYRILVSDLIVLTMCEEGTAHDELRRRIAELKELPIVATVLRPRPLGDVARRRVAYFTTAGARAQKLLSEHLRSAHGADVAFVSGNLAARDALRNDLAALPDVEAFLIEIKAAAIDVVAEAAAERGVETIFVGNDVVPLPGQPDLDAELRALAEAAAKEPVPS